MVSGRPMPHPRSSCSNSGTRITRSWTRLASVSAAEKSQDLPDNPVDSPQTTGPGPGHPCHRTDAPVHGHPADRGVWKRSVSWNRENHRTHSTLMYSFPIPATTMHWSQHSRQKPIPLVGPDHHFSASALKKYEDCPLCYKFQYVLQVPSLPKTFFSMGTAVHSVIELRLESTAGRVIFRQKSRPSNCSIPAGRRRPIPPGPMNSRTGSKPKRCSTRISHGRQPTGTPSPAAEKKFQFPLNGRMVKGYIDRIEQTPEGEYVVVDFKTGSKPVPHEEFCAIRYPAQPLLPCHQGNVRETPPACIVLLHQRR